MQWYASSTYKLLIPKIFGHLLILYSQLQTCRMVLEPQSLDTIVATNLVPSPLARADTQDAAGADCYPACGYPFGPRRRPRRFYRHSSNLQPRPDPTGTKRRPLRIVD